MTARLWAAGLLATALVVAPPPARAQPAPPHLDLDVAGSLDDGIALAERLIPRLGGTEARVVRVQTVDTADVLAPVAARPGRLARAWVDLRDRGVARLYLAAPAVARVLVRQVPTPAGVDEVAQEQIVEILAAAVEAVRAGNPVGGTVEEARRTLVPTRAAPPTPLDVALGAFAQAQGWSSATGVTPGGGLAARIAWGRPWAVWALGDWHAPLQAEDQAVGVRLSGGGAAVLWAYEHPVGSRLGLGVAVGPGLELRNTLAQPRPDATLEGARRHRELAVLARALARLELRPGGGVTPFIAAGADVPLVQARYGIEVDGGRRTVLSPWPVRPIGLVGLTIQLR